MGELKTTRFKWTGICRAQSNEFIVPGDNIAFFSKPEASSECRQLKNEAYISGLELPEGF